MKSDGFTAKRLTTFSSRLLVDFEAPGIKAEARCIESNVDLVIISWEKSAVAATKFKKQVAEFEAPYGNRDLPH